MNPTIQQNTEASSNQYSNDANVSDSTNNNFSVNTASNIPITTSSIPNSSALAVKPSKLYRLFAVLGIIQLLGFAVNLWMIVRVNNDPMDSTGFSLFWVVIIIFMMGVAAFINVVGLPIFMLRQKPRGKSLIFCIISLILSLLIASSYLTSMASYTR